MSGSVGERGGERGERGVGERGVGERVGRGVVGAIGAARPRESELTALSRGRFPMRWISSISQCSHRLQPQSR